MDLSIESKISNLNKIYLRKSLNFNNQNAIILVWNGVVKNILFRLGFHNIVRTQSLIDNAI